jgi:3-isopropylmalate/(R)-2-methylmalate dehydratase small subunit
MPPRLFLMTNKKDTVPLPEDLRVFLTVIRKAGFAAAADELAVWGLKQMGIRALIGSSFAGIFYDNCQRNGVLLITLDEAVLQTLGKTVSQADQAQISVDLEAQQIRLADGEVIAFQIDTLRKSALLLGLDAIGSTLQRSDEIKAFERRHLQANPWLN